MGSKPFARPPALGLMGLVLAAGLLLGSCGRAGGNGRNVIILGFDGMDWGLTRQMMDDGQMPNFARMAAEGVGQPLGTSVPPLSPVAWSDFVTGLDSGGHGIFDFLHRDPATRIPFLSTSEQLPDGSYELLRHGTPFWEVLEEAGIETTILRMPANFPPSGSATRELSGMGTPDIHGTPGQFYYYTTEFDTRDINGGEIHQLRFFNQKAEGKLFGPEVDGKKVTVPFDLYVDVEEPVAKLVVGEEERILGVAEWSDWLPVSFPVPGVVDLQAAARFYIMELDPEIKLYVSPLNFDPLERVWPLVGSPAPALSTPRGYARELAAATGRFYTQGMPEETNALREEVFSREQFLSQAAVSGREFIDQYEYVLDEFEGGLLFYYFGNIDLTSHMIWHTLDEQHPRFDPETDLETREVIYDLYRGADEIVGRTLEAAGDNTTVIVMSDHGFASWRRTLHLNAWLRENGYLAVKDPNAKGDKFYSNVDWSRTRAYALGLNGLYINLAGREKGGTVPTGERERLMEEIAAKLLATRDPENDALAVTKVYKREEHYRDRGHLEVGPDMVIGYAKHYDGDGDSALGEETMAPVFADNMGQWAGDHGMDHESVPGVLFVSQPLSTEVESLRDLAAAVVAEFGLTTEFPPG